jgi:HK97 family phage major capsid protein
MQHISNFPRALSYGGFRVRAEETPQQLFGQLRTAIESFRDDHDQRLANMETALTTISAGNPAITAPALSAGVDPEYTRTFANYFRKGEGEDTLRKANSSGERATIQAAMSVGTAGDGGFLAPVEWDRKIAEAQKAISPMRRLANVQATSVGAFTTLWNTEQWGSGWVGESAARPQTSNTSLAQVPFSAGEIYAMPAVTQRLLDDAAINVDNWLVEQVRKEFSRQEGIAFLSGDGSNKPSGFLSYITGGANDGTHPGGNIEVTQSAITVDGLIDFMYGLDAPYRQNATWLMSSLTAAVIAKMKDANGNLIWRESLIAGQPSMLLGRPVEIDEGMPAPDPGNMPIALADWKAGYLINDRIGTRILRDPYTNKPFVMFYVTKRVGGGVLDPNAIKVLQLPAA